VEFNYILIGISGGLAFGIVVIGVSLLYISLVKRRISRKINDFISAPDNETPSPLASLFDSMAYVVAARLVHQIKTTIGGMNSVDAKNARREAVQEAMQANPTLAGLAQFLPKRWLKPEILQAGAALLSKVGNRGNGQDSNPVKQGTFNL
jgi:hypothetical protein